MHAVATEAVFNPTPGNSGGVNQAMYRAYGNAWILAEYPGINLITDMLIPEKQFHTNRTNNSTEAAVAA